MCPSLSAKQAQSRDRRRRLVRVVSGAVFVTINVLVVVIVIDLSQTSGGDTNLEDVGLVRHELKGIPQRGMVLGEPNAKATLIEFGDLQCPVCKAYSEQVIPQVISGPVRRGSAKIDFRNLTVIGPQSISAGAAAVAAGMQGHGWNFIELFYRNQGLENTGYVNDSFLRAIAKGAGVPDIRKWNRDRKRPRALNRVSYSTDQAHSFGFNATPSFAVRGPNGTKPLGALATVGEIESAMRQAR